MARFRAERQIAVVADSAMRSLAALESSRVSLRSASNFTEARQLYLDNLLEVLARETAETSMS